MASTDQTGHDGTIRVVSWNLNCFTDERRDEKAVLLGSFDWDIAVLQEVTAPTFTRLLELLAGEGVDGASALDLCEVHDHRRPLGCAVLVRRPLQITATALVPGQPRPERGLHVGIHGLHGPLTACSWHAPNRVLVDEAAQHRLVHGSSRGQGRNVITGEPIHDATAEQQRPKP